MLILYLINVALKLQIKIYFLCIKIIKEALLQTLAEGIGDRFKSCNRKSWSNVIDYFGSQMSKGMS